MSRPRPRLSLSRNRAEPPLLNAAPKPKTGGQGLLLAGGAPGKDSGPPKRAKSLLESTKFREALSKPIVGAVEPLLAGQPKLPSTDLKPDFDVQRDKLSKELKEQEDSLRRLTVEFSTLLDLMRSAVSDETATVGHDNQFLSDIEDLVDAWDELVESN